MRKPTRNPMDRQWAVTKVIVDAVAEHGIPKDHEEIKITATGVEANGVPLGDWEILVRRK